MLFVLFVVVAHGSWQIYGKASIARAERDEAARKLAEVESHTKELEANIAWLKSDRGIEEEVRQKFTVARFGEEVVVVVDESNKKSKDSGTDSGPSFWNRFLSFLRQIL